MTLAVLLDMRATTLTRVFQPYRLGRADMRGRWSLARASFPASQRAEAHLQPFASRILQAQANGGSRAALRAIRRASTRTEYRNQRFTRLAAHRTIGLNGPDVCCRAITLLAFVTLFAFVPWGTLRSPVDPVLQPDPACRGRLGCLAHLVDLRDLGAQDHPLDRGPVRKRQARAINRLLRWRRFSL